MDTAANNVSAQKVILKQVYYKMFEVYCIRLLYVCVCVCLYSTGLTEKQNH